MISADLRSTPLAALDAPFHIAAVTLAGRAPEALARFYEGLGLERVSSQDEAAVLGAGGEGWLRIVPAAAPAAETAALADGSRRSVWRGRPSKGPPTMA